jgi:pimeloyl-ACP methyl ester carboxylesterase
LRADGLEVTALTLPGLESKDADRSSVTLSHHVDAICDAVRAAGPPVVLAVHSGTGFSGYAATDRIPELIARMVYVDSAPGKGALDPGLEGDKEFNWEEIAAEENLDGLSEEQLETFRQRAVPEPGGVFREVLELTNDARLDLPTTMICTGFPAEQIRRPPRSTTGPGSPASASSATSHGSTCRRATGRCGRDRRISQRSSPTSRAQPADRRRAAPRRAARHRKRVARQPHRRATRVP